MKKVIIFLICLFLGFSVFADLVNSNILGQVVDLNSDYKLQVGDKIFSYFPENPSLEGKKSTNILFYKDKQIKVFEYYLAFKENHENRCEVSINLTNGKRIKDFYLDGYKTKRIFDGGKSVVTTNYFYTNGYLSYETISKEDSLKFIYFYRNNLDQSLIAMKVYESDNQYLVLVNKNYQVENGKLITKGNNGLYITQDLNSPEVKFSNENDKFTVTEVDKKDNLLTNIKVFNNQGLQESLEKKKDNEIIYNKNYTYLENELVKTIEIESDKTTINEYENNVLKKQTIKENDVTIKIVNYNEDKVVETLFEKGEAFANVTYGPDRIKILSIDYL
ncbi:MAG: hypothetical protein WC162_01950 [Sphaerochaetaceae bacterium]|nr:hypothetical protein [Sphaerochaetaceae bacterium]